MIGDFRPRRSRALIEQGRIDARRAVASLEANGPAERPGLNLPQLTARR